MRYLLKLIVLLLVSGNLHAQIEPDDENVNLDTIFPNSAMPPADSCSAPIVVDVSVIQFATYAEAQVSLFPKNLVQNILYRELDNSGLESFTAPVENGRALVANLQKNKVYQILVNNHCGVPTAIGIISTKTEFEGTVTVSEELHAEINRYLKTEQTTKLTDFIRELNIISLFEKISFVQRFFFKGAPLEDGAVLTVPEITITTACFCNSLITTQLAIPSNLLFLTPESGLVNRYTQLSSGGNSGNNLGQNARTWEWLDNEGAAKYHQVWTEGFKAKKGLDHADSITWQATNGIASQKSYIRVTLLCLDSDEVPAECACEKDVEFAYRYDTRVTAHAQLVSGSGSGSKNAWAQAEDMYSVIFEDESKPLSERYEVLRLGAVRAASACDWSVNPAFWTTITSLLGDAAKVYLAYSATQNQGGQPTNQTQQTALINSITDFAGKLGTLFTTPYGQSTQCGNDDDKIDGIEKQSIQRTLKPNATVTLTMSSFDRIATGGRRAWHSYGKILSGHFLTGIVKHNAYDGTPVHCCTPLVGMWLVGNCDGPISDDMLKVEAADLLYHNGITNLIQTPFGRQVVNDFGYTVQNSSLAHCNLIVVNPTVTGGRSDQSDGTPSDTEGCVLRIFDLNGRFVASKAWNGNPAAVDTRKLTDEYAHLPTGIYLLQIASKTRTTTTKIFID